MEQKCVSKTDLFNKINLDLDPPQMQYEEINDTILIRMPPKDTSCGILLKKVPGKELHSMFKILLEKYMKENEDKIDLPEPPELDIITD